MKSQPTIQSNDSSPLLGLRSKKRAGTTLVEALVALSIFAVFTTGACKLMLSHRQISDMARGHYTAGNIAKNRLEQMRAFEFAETPNFVESNVVVDESGLPNSVGNYRRTTTVSSVAPNLYDVMINVEIRNRKTLVFTPAHETVRSFIAHYLEPGE